MRIKASGIYIYIYIPELNGVGAYGLELSNGSISDNPSYPHAFIIKNNKDDSRELYYSYENSGQIMVTKFDTINTKVSGTFEFQAFGVDNPSDTLEITDGRFDINWSALSQD